MRGRCLRDNIAPYAPVDFYGLILTLAALNDG